MSFLTADICDDFIDQLQVADPLFNNYGGKKVFHGSIATVKCFEDNVLVKQYLQQAGDGRVLVVDGGGSMRCALLGDRLATLALQNGWAGVVIYGCIRDSVEIGGIEVGVKAMQTCPRKSIKRGEGQQDIVLKFAGVTFAPNAYLYADDDGIVVAAEELPL